MTATMATHAKRVCLKVFKPDFKKAYSKTEKQSFY